MYDPNPGTGRISLCPACVRKLLDPLETAERGYLTEADQKGPARSHRIGLPYGRDDGPVSGRSAQALDPKRAHQCTDKTSIGIYENSHLAITQSKN
jgi:hypothetical protein